MAMTTKNGRRAVVVGGVRTPFVKAFTEFTKLDTIALGVAAVRGAARAHAASRTATSSRSCGAASSSRGPRRTSAARSRSICASIRRARAMTVTRACASGLQAVTLAAAAIERGEADVVIAGGSDSTSNAEIKLPQKVVHALAPLALGKPDAGRLPRRCSSQLLPISEHLAAAAARRRAHARAR